MHAPVSHLTTLKLSCFITTALLANASWAQAPNWLPVIEGESLYVDMASVVSSPNQPPYARWVEFDMVLNTPVPSTQEDADKLNAYFGLEPKSFFNHVTVNCEDITLREQSNGIAYGHFQTPRRDHTGKSVKPFELDQLIEYDLHSDPQFEAITSTPEAKRYAELICSSAPEASLEATPSLAFLGQAVPNVTQTPKLVPLAHYPHKFIDQASIRPHQDAPHQKDFNIVYQMPKDDPQFLEATAPYGLDQFTIVFDRTMNCQDKSMRSNYRAITSHYQPSALLIEYRPQEGADYLPISGEEQSLYDLICPTPEVVMPIVIKPAKPVSNGYKEPRRPMPFRTEYD